MPADRLEPFYAKRPLVLAHRGASFHAPENTLAAFRLALEQGADGVELDTMLSADGIPVVIHDFTLDKTTNGHGPVREYDLRMLKTLDAGSHFDFEFKGETIPTLDEALETLGGEAVVNIELKAQGWRDDGLPSAVANTLRRHANKKYILISSFNPFTLRRFRALAPDVPLGFLYAPDTPVYLRAFLWRFPHEARHPHESMIDARYMAWASAHRYRVHTWTVDDPARVVQLRELGVEALITNQPLRTLEALGRVNARKGQRE